MTCKDLAHITCTHTGPAPLSQDAVPPHGCRGDESKGQRSHSQHRGHHGPHASQKLHPKSSVLNSGETSIFPFCNAGFLGEGDRRRPRHAKRSPRGEASHPCPEPGAVLTPRGAGRWGRAPSAAAGSVTPTPAFVPHPRHHSCSRGNQERGRLLPPLHPFAQRISNTSNPEQRALGADPDPKASPGRGAASSPFLTQQPTAARAVQAL